MTGPTETCANCGNLIGKLQTPYIWHGNVVCDSCYDLLMKQNNPAYRAVAGRPKPPGGFLDPQRNRSVARVLFRVFFWIIAGLIILFLLSQIEWANRAGR